MRFGTWNVEYGFGPRNPDRLAALAAHPADIWVLTETHRDLDLSASHTPVYSDPRKLRREGSRWVALWSRFPLLRVLTTPDPGRMAAALFDTPAGPLAVAGVVLPWHSDRGDAGVVPQPKNWEEHRRVIAHEVPSLLRGLREQAPGARRVFAGDFNTSLAPPHSYGVKDGRATLAALLEAESLVCHTAQVRYPSPAPDYTLIDHVCTDLWPSGGVETWSGKDGTKPRMSDHPGVVVTFPG